MNRIQFAQETGQVLIVAKCIVNEKIKAQTPCLNLVLIVAKCIVNKNKYYLDETMRGSINSSKVYCK